MLNLDFFVRIVPATMGVSGGCFRPEIYMIFVLPGGRLIRVVCTLPVRTHCYLLPLSCNCLPIFD